MPSIVIYFSRAGENYVNGEIKKLKTGNTQLAAEILSKATGSDLFRVEPLIKILGRIIPNAVEEAQSDLQRNCASRIWRLILKILKATALYIWLILITAAPCPCPCLRCWKN